MPRLIRRPSLLLIAALCGTMGCAAAHPGAPAGTNHDPLEGMNRGIFWFNTKVDDYVLEPVAKGWDTVAPARVQKSVSNFFHNLRFPIVAVNGLLQGKLVQSASDVGRFAVNTTVGFLGFFDPATDWGLVQHNEDFGQTLGYWGVPPGPYLVLPFFGPSDPRDTVGLAADSFSTVYPFFISFFYTFGANAVDTVNSRALVLREVRQIKEASLDYYVAVRNAYTQRRAALVADQKEKSAQEQQDLYQLEDEQ
jgi:phospholipid-binding lipoprotein MlaA